MRRRDLQEGRAALLKASGTTAGLRARGAAVGREVKLSPALLWGIFSVPLLRKGEFLASERRPPGPGSSPDCAPARAGGTEEQVRSSGGSLPLRKAAPATPTLGAPRPQGPRPVGRDPLPHAACANGAENVGKSGSAAQIVIRSATPASPRQLTREQSGKRSEGRGARPRPHLAPPHPELGATPGQVLPPRALGEGGKWGHVTVPRPGERRLRPSHPRQSSGHGSKTHRPQPRASPVAAARPQSHRQVQALPRRERAERSR